MNREVEKMLPNALRAVRTYLLQDEAKLIAYKEYDGYAANLGASIRQSGLLPALSFFTDVHKIKKNETSPRRNYLLAAILLTLGEEAIPADKEERGRELLRRVLTAGYGADIFKEENLNPAITVDNPTNSEALNTWKKRILEATVALKLALRTFAHSTDDHPNID